MLIFKLPNSPKGRKVINKRYLFVDGIMKVSDSDGEKLKSTLCRFYSCTCETEKIEPGSDGDGDSDSSNDDKDKKPTIVVADTKSVKPPAK